MMGRAGRKGFDPQGDVYIFVPASKQRVEIDRIQSKCQIDSHTLDIEQNIYRELSFHLIGEFVKRKFTKNDVIAWHSRSFSCFEGIEIHTITLTETLNKLKELGLVKYEDNMYEVTNLGSISVYNYMCPFVVAALKINFNNLFANNLQNNFLDIAFALANHSGFFKEFLSKEDESKIPEFVDRFRTNFGTDISGGIVKAAYIYHTLLTGATVHHFHNLLPTIKFDFERVAGVLKQIDSRVTKWNKSKYFDNVANQIRYGVPAHLIPLVGIPGIGAVRAKRLYDSGFKTADDVRRNLEFASQVAGVKIK
jgi:helicase